MKGKLYLLTVNIGGVKNHPVYISQYLETCITDMEKIFGEPIVLMDEDGPMRHYGIPDRVEAEGYCGHVWEFDVYTSRYLDEAREWAKALGYGNED